ncbi:MAG TPA: 3D domain-containing protein [Kofleriaceae bacterium]|nr:3D domain-containing protein [Kofleriaceae bacterium]
MDGSDGGIAWCPSNGTLAAIASALGSSARFVVDVIGRIVNGIHAIGRIAPLVLGLGCQSTEEAVPVAQPAAVQAPAPPATEPAEAGPRPLGKFTITFYYVIGEDEVTSKPVLVAANDNRANSDEDTDLAAIAPDLVTLYAGGGQCEPIAEVSKQFASQLAIQGTGKLHDGRVLNIWGACNCKHTPCFKVTQAQWGTAGSGRPLQPFRTVAVDPKVVRLGSLLYVPLLEGRTMPGRQPWGGYIHDGCVVADDTGGHIAGNRLDLFVGRKGYFLGLSGSGGSHAWARHVPVFDGTGICERKGRRVARKAASI